MKHLMMSVCVIFLVVGASAVEAQPAFSKSFQPPTIGPGSTSALIFSIANGNEAPATGMSFSDTLPVGVTIATPSGASNSCGGILSAPDGGDTISLAGGLLGALESCEIRVNVTSSAGGVHTNVSGDLTSDAGNSGTATADLTVDFSLPGFSKSFDVSVIPIGGRSTLTFVIDNSLNEGEARFNLSFSDTLPSELVVAGPTNAVSTCSGGIIGAVPGASTISFGPDFAIPGSASVGALASCTVSVDVVGVGVGEADNLSGELTSTGLQSPTARSSGMATASIEVTANSLLLTKQFVNDPVNPGDPVTLKFEIRNLNRTDSATNISFSDDLDAALAGLAVSGVLPTNPCGVGSSLSGTSLVSLSGGNLAPESICTFSMTLQVPAGAVRGAYPNTTTAPTADIGGEAFTGLPASDVLFVNLAPKLSKAFLTNPVGSGQTTSLEFTIQNSSSTLPATGIGFQDPFAVVLPSALIAGVPAAGFCGAGSLAYATDIAGVQILVVTGANLAAGGSCTFTVDYAIAEGTPPGAYDNTTGFISGIVDGEAQVGAPATDTLVVVAAPSLRKEFTDDPVLPGGTATLEFNLSYDEFATSSATSISFSDDLDAMLTGAAATGLPANDICGVGSQISGTSSLSFSGGTLAPGESCTFTVSVAIPAAALPGLYTNTSSDVQAITSGTAVTGPPSVGQLLVAGLRLSKEFTDDPLLPGQTGTLQFALDNSSGTTDATAISFTDALGSVLSGLDVVGTLPTEPCGLGSALVEISTGFLSFSGGNLLAGEQCSFSVSIQVPGGAAQGDYLNTTSALSANLGGTPVSLPTASDLLFVQDEYLALSKSFTNDPVAPGGTVTLEFVLENQHPSETATAISFVDDLDAVVAGLAATGLPVSGVCGVGSQISGASVLSFTGGELAAGASCTFTVSVDVPAGTDGGGLLLNTTSGVTGTILGLPVTGFPATDALQLLSLDLSKSFDGPTVAGGAPVLSFTITNLSASTPASALSFSDDLAAVLPGLVATGTPLTDPCGGGSQLSGTSFLSFVGGSLPAGGSCTVNVPLQVPVGAAPGSYPNVSSELFSGGLPAAAVATATLQVEPPPLFSKSFTPSLIGSAQVSTLGFVIDNGASAVAASNLDFTDNLPAAVVVANPANAVTTCTGGTLTAVPGTGVISYSGGSVAAGAICSVSVDVTSAVPGSHVNTTGNLVSSSGDSGTAMATLQVEPPPLFSKSFTPALVGTGQSSTLGFVIDNTASALAATNLDFTDTFPAGVVVATPPNAATSCTGGTLTAASGTAVVSYAGGSVAAGVSCSIFVDVSSESPGIYVNTTGNLSSSSGDSGTATATLEVQAVDFSLAKTFIASPVLPGGLMQLEYTITNNTGGLTLSDLAFTDDLGAVVSGFAAQGLPAAGVCGAGSTLSGTSVVSLTGGNLAPGASCTFAATVAVPAAAPLGLYTSVSSVLNGLVGGMPDTAPAAAAGFEVVYVDFLKSFAGEAVPGAQISLSFEINNPDPVNAVTGISFTDDLDAVLSGLQAVGLPQNDVCGVGSVIDGGSLLVFSGGSLPAGGSCSFSVPVQLPDPAAPGTYTNITGPLDVQVAGTAVSGGASSAAQASFQVRQDNAIPTLGGLATVILITLLAAFGIRRLRF